MRYLLLLLFICSSISFYAQTVAFRADCNAKDVVVGNPFKVSFVLENADVRNISFPNFDKDGFSVMQGPMNESRYMNVNGKASYTESYVFLLAPKKTGKYSLGPAKVVTTKGKTFSTKSIEINSVAASGKNSADAKDNLPAGISGKVIFRMVPSTKEAVPGEQVMIDMKVYTQLDLASIGMTLEPKSKQVDLFPTNFSDQATSVDVINGRQYASKTIYRFTFTAGSPGTIDINPAKIEFIEAYGSSPFGRPANYSLFSNPLSIEVKEFKNQPATFSGAVGKYNLFCSVDKTGINSDDFLKVIVSVSGVGELKKITEVPLRFGKKGEKPFNLYPPKIEENIEEGPEGKSGIKDFVYTLEPKSIGDFELRPTLTYFDTDLRRFVTVDTVIPVRVIQGKKILGKDASIADRDLDSKNTKLSFGPIAEKAYWKRPGSPFFGSILFWILAFLPIVLFIALASSKLYLQKRYEAMMKHNALTKAHRDLNEHMKNAQSFLSAGDAPAFYQAISEAFKNFLGKKLKIPKSEISKELLAEKLEGLLDEDKIRSLTRILKICELSVFAGQDNKQAMQLVFDESNELFIIFSKTFS